METISISSLESLPWSIQQEIIHYYWNTKWMNKNINSVKDRLQLALVNWRWFGQTQIMFTKHLTNSLYVNYDRELRQHIESKYCILKSIAHLDYNESLDGIVNLDGASTNTSSSQSKGVKTPLGDWKSYDMYSNLQSISIGGVVEIGGTKITPTIALLQDIYNRKVADNSLHTINELSLNRVYFQPSFAIDCQGEIKLSVSFPFHQLFGHVSSLDFYLSVDRLSGFLFMLQLMPSVRHLGVMVKKDIKTSHYTRLFKALPSHLESIFLSTYNDRNEVCDPVPFQHLCHTSIRSIRVSLKTISEHTMFVDTVPLIPTLTDVSATPLLARADVFKLMQTQSAITKWCLAYDRPLQANTTVTSTPLHTNIQRLDVHIDTQLATVMDKILMKMNNQTLDTVQVVQQLLIDNVDKLDHSIHTLNIRLGIEYNLTNEFITAITQFISRNQSLTSLSIISTPLDGGNDNNTLAPPQPNTDNNPAEEDTNTQRTPISSVDCLAFDPFIQSISNHPLLSHVTIKLFQQLDQPLQSANLESISKDYHYSLTNDRLSIKKRYYLD